MGDVAGPQRMANTTLLAQAAPYVRAIMNSSDTSFSRLECPEPSLDRYKYLREPPDSLPNVRLPRYFFALNLYQCLPVLPRLLGSIVQVIRYLGPENCVLSIVEGRSNDGTYEVLKELKSDIEDLEVRYIFKTSDLNPATQG